MEYKKGHMSFFKAENFFSLQTAPVVKTLL